MLPPMTLRLSSLPREPLFALPDEAFAPMSDGLIA
jgi:hypothetical protein